MSDSPRTPLSKRRVYTLAEKASALRQMNDENLTFAQMEKLSSIPQKSLSSWAKNSDQILQYATVSSPRLPGGGRKPPFPELESFFIEFVKEQRTKKLMVNKQILKSKALWYCKESNNEKYKDFKACLSWVRNFCVRHFLSYREGTHQSQQKLREPNFEYNTCKKYLIALQQLT